MDLHARYGGASLLTGWLPLIVEFVALAMLLAVVARRSRHWWLVQVPTAVVVGVLCIALAFGYWDSSGIPSDAAPRMFWWWIGATGVTASLAVLGARRSGWGRRTLSVMAVILTALATGLTLNQQIGYFPTINEALSQLTGSTMASTEASLETRRNTAGANGTVVSISTGSARSGFAHRAEYAYLPPAWFRGSTPPHLPALMMIGGEFNTTADWIRIGDAVADADNYAHRHDGMAPILVFPDVSGHFGNDTECVNGPRGQVTTHLLDEVRPYIVRRFGADSGGAGWGVAGFSMGGTCAVDLVTEHPDLFSAFDDIAGDAAPNAGDAVHTVKALFGGDAAAYDDFNPETAMVRHGTYRDVYGWFDEAAAGSAHRAVSGNQTHPIATATYTGHVIEHTRSPQLAAARELCAEGVRVNIRCSIRVRPGGHTWQFAASAFRSGFAQLAQQLDTAPKAPSLRPLTIGYTERIGRPPGRWSRWSPA
ncbi:MAG: alpha/beta hydrolase-fold protein [Gordonia sp. (in: high G+C Gram-positive bacteria)]